MGAPSAQARHAAGAGAARRDCFFAGTAARSRAPPAAMAPPLFAKLKFYVLPVNTLDIPRRAELVALLKAHGGEAVTRLEAISLGAAVMF